LAGGDSPPHRERQVVLLNTVDVDLQTVVRAIDLLRSAGVEQIDFVVVPAPK
jgi:biopolymer transport protein ExbD